MSSDQDNVAVFWDYENCPIPGNLTGYGVANTIRRIAQEFGSVTLFKAYLGFSEQTQCPRSLCLRSELQASGVSLTDCPHNGRKDVADKMMLVDMLAHAIDHPTPTTFLLISGDRDFSYALSILRLRRYRVILITSPNAHATLTAQASVRLNWVSNVLHTSSTQKETSSQVNLSFAEAQKPGAVCNHQKPKVLFSPRDFTSDPDSTLVVNDGSPRKRPGLRSANQTQNDTLPPIASAEQTQGAPTSFFGTPFRLPTKPIGPLTPGRSQDMRTSEKRAEKKEKARESPLSQPPSEPMTESENQFPDAQFCEEYQSDMGSSHPESSEEAGPRYENYSLWDSARGDPSSPQTRPSKRPSESGASASSLKSSIRNGSYTPIPPQFKPLVKQLKLYRSKGIYIPQRAILCIDICKKYKRIYQNAGVEDFAEYVSLAEKEGFVTLGGGDGLNPWIMLRQEWV